MKVSLFLVAAFAMLLQNRVPVAIPASLSGYVLETMTGRPIAGATVSLVDGPGQATLAMTAKTEADGHFRIDGIAPGDYGVMVSKEGYIFGRAYAGNRFGDRRLTLGSGEQRTDLIFRLQGTGTLSGRVLDSNGRPVVEATVVAMRFVYHDFQRDVTTVADRRTDDRGEYRMFNVPAGQYIVLASGRASGVGSVVYPGERELARAQRIEVRAEQETRLRDLTMPPPLRGSIRARVVNATGGPLPATINIESAAQGFASSLIYSFVSRGQRQGASADIRELQPGLVGPYVLSMAMQTVVGNVGGYALVDYAGVDTDVDFIIGKLEGQIKGRVLLEGADGSVRPLAAAEMEFYGMSAESAFSKPDGTFSINGLLRGPFQFSGAFEMPKGYYVTSVRERGRDLLREILMVSQTTPEVEVRVRADGGSVEGKVTDTRNRVAQDAVVALVPLSQLESRSDRHNTYRIEHSTTAGLFELRDIIPGEYLVYAWSAVEEEAVMDPWFMEIYKGKGLPLKVEPGGGRLKMDLRILDE